jgi:hypothetical protein
MPYGHRHREQEEDYVIADGCGRLKLDDELVDVAPWDVVRVAPVVMRALEAGRTDWSCCVSAGDDRPAETPNATRLSGVRAPGTWGRARTMTLRPSRRGR